MEWLNFRHLYAFWSVCRYGGFQKAAEKILVSQSAISDQVSQLENYLGQTLIQRTTRSFKVTYAGTELLKLGDEIFALSGEINRTFKDNKNLVPDRSVRIGMVGGISRNFVYRMIVQSMIENEDANLSVIDGSFEELSSLLKSLEIDLVLSLEVPRKKDLLNLSFKKILTSPMCVAGKPEIIKKLRSRRKNVSSLSLFLFNHHFEGDVVDDFLKPKFNLDIKVPVITDDISLLRFMAHSGRGAAFLPEVGIQEDLDSGSLSRIIFDEVPPIDFFAIFLKKGGYQAAIKELIL